MLKFISERELTLGEKEKVKKELRGYLRESDKHQTAMKKFERNQIAKKITDPIERKKFLKGPIIIPKSRLRVKFIAKN